MHYKSTTLKEIIHWLAGSMTYSELDANTGFWRIKLTHNTSVMTTFSTHLGRYRFKYMPLSLMSQVILLMKMSQMLEWCLSILCIHDDLHVYGKTKQEHNNNLLSLMWVASTNGLTFNSKKMPNWISPNHILWDKIQHIWDEAWEKKPGYN